MKFLLLFLSMTSAACAMNIKVHGYEQEPHIERSILLRTNLEQKVALDCQSFINGLRIGEFDDASYFMMDPNECDYLLERIKKSVREKRNHCLEVESDIENDYSC
jgi:hypothetical protein